MMTTPSIPLPNAGVAQASADHSATTANPANGATAVVAEERAARARIPLSSVRQRLATPEIPGYHTHWINDYPGRIEQAIAGGYEFVEKASAVVTAQSTAGAPVGAGTDLGSRVSIVVGKQEGGTPLRAYLMKIRQEWYNEDQQATQGHVDAIHDALRRGKQKVDGESAADSEQRYVKRVRMESTYSRRPS